QELCKTDDVALLALLDTSVRTGEPIPLDRVAWLRRHAARLRAMTMAELPAYLAMRLRNIANVCRRTVLTNLFRWGLSYANSGKRPIPRWLFRPVEAND
nr:hypothetical protein [Desulfuromonadales bacterium]